MLAYVEAIERENTITIDGYTSNRTEKGIIKDVAKAVSKYNNDEAECLLNSIICGDNPFLKAIDSEGGYFFECEEVSCATRYNEEADEIECKEGYKNYFCIRIVK